MPKSLTRDEFIKRSREIHGDKYDYSKVVYANNTTKVCIICPVHGEFWQTPYGHMKGQGCFKCGNYKKGQFRKLNIESFIEKARAIHGNKYDYSKVEYVNSSTKVCIICPEHGEFWQKPNNHLNGEGCPICNGGIKSDLEAFIRKANIKHNNKFDYSKVEYVNSTTKVCIICPEHGEFWQTPHDHLSGYGCPRCVGRLKTTEDFIREAKEIHGDRYDYSKTEYVKASDKVCIICPEHGEFWQRPAEHLQGHGCPCCKESRLEKKCARLLEKYGIAYERQKKFDWLGLQSLDFYLGKYKVAIECQGKQHFLENHNFGKNKAEALSIVQERDERKKKLCNENGIRMVYYADAGIEFPYKVITDKVDLVREIIS